MAGNKKRPALSSSLTLKTLKSLAKSSTDPIVPLKFEPFNWLKDATIYNNKWEQIPTNWLIENADMVVLLFTARGVNRQGILERFYHIYEDAKAYLPIEVIFIPMDETEEDASACFEAQANWFSLHFDDILIHTLKYMYEVTCIPYLTVIKTNCEVISYNGIADLDLHGKNAVISWLTESPSTKKHRRRSEDADKYGPIWRFVKQEEKLIKYEYQSRFDPDGGPVEDQSQSPGYSGQPESDTAPAKDYSQPPMDKAETSDGQTDTETQASDAQSSETPAKLPEGRSKSATITAPFPESQGQETRSKSAGSRGSLGLRSSAVHIKLPEQPSKPSETEIPTESGPRTSKIHVSIPDGKPPDGQSSETRPKSAKGRRSDSNVQVKETRIKSAKFADVSEP